MKGRLKLEDPILVTDTLEAIYETFIYCCLIHLNVLSFIYLVIHSLSFRGKRNTGEGDGVGCYRFPLTVR